MDYYKTLGINKEATEEEIKKAYRKLAHQYHPDKGGGDEKKFKEINEAYQVLSNKEKRDAYDRFGMAGLGAGGTPGWGGFPFGGGGFTHGVEFGFGGDAGDIGDIFDAFFEGLGVKSKRKSYNRGADLEISETVTLEEAFRGVTKKIAFKTFIKCETCKGDGADLAAGTTTCGKCGGQGEVKESRRTFFGSYSQVKQCDKCFATGKIPNKTCKSCGGAGRVKRERDITFNILQGINDGQIVKIQGGGEAGERGAGAGDLYMRIRVKSHTAFKRNGADLFLRQNIDLVHALLQDEVTITGIDGKKIKVNLPPGFDFTEPVKILGEGMPKFGGYGRGDLILQFNVSKPAKIDAKLKKFLDDMK